MKRKFGLLIIFILIAGCSTPKPRLIAQDPAETIDNSSAYVLGKTNESLLEIQWEHAEEFGERVQTIVFKNDENYNVYKIRPGKYTFMSALCKNAQTGLELIQPMDNGKAYFIAVPGKITYLGEMTLSDCDSASVGHFKQMDFNFTKIGLSLDVQDKSRAAKTAIRKKYPHLANRLDAMFIFQPPVPGKFRKVEDDNPKNLLEQMFSTIFSIF